VIDVGDQRDVTLPLDEVRVFPLRADVDPDIQLMAPRWNVGVTGYLAGLTVALVDKNGLSDPIASRLRLETRGRPGHEKSLPNAWVIARFASSTTTDLDRAVVAARAALACGDLAELRSAVEAPLTLERFLKNVRQAWRLYRLRIPADPVAAQRELCT
jgi:arabinofuranosyltransferase